MGRIGRSLQLVAQSYRLLIQDKELMVLPMMSGAIIAVVVVALYLGFGIDTAAVEQRGPGFYIPLLILYVVTYAVGIFFQAAVIAGATERMRGGDPTVASALAAAARRLGPICLWALVAGTVGLILRAIQNRAGFIGRIVVGFAGAAWSLATLFVVPVLVLEDRSIGESFNRSVGLFKKTWGETFVGGSSIGVVAFAAWMTLVAVVGVLAWAQLALVALVVGVGGAIFLAAFFSALQGIYVASLYRYASDGQPPAGFDAGVLAQAFVPKR